MWRSLRKNKYETSGSVFSDTFQILAKDRKGGYSATKNFSCLCQIMHIAVKNNLARPIYIIHLQILII